MGALQRLDPFTGGNDGDNALIKPEIKGGIAFVIILIAFLALAQATRCEISRPSVFVASLRSIHVRIQQD